MFKTFSGLDILFILWYNHKCNKLIDAAGLELHLYYYPDVRYILYSNFIAVHFV